MLFLPQNQKQSIKNRWIIGKVHIIKDIQFALFCQFEFIFDGTWHQLEMKSNYRVILVKILTLTY